MGALPPQVRQTLVGERRDGLERILALVRDHLEMDVAFVSEFTDAHQIYRELEGDHAAFGLSEGTGPRLERTVCQRVVRGEAPAVIPDLAREPSVRDLAATSARGIGAYVGVPLRFSDGRLYGTFCCLRRDPDRTLDVRDARFMQLLAEIIADDLEAREELRRIRHRLRGALAGDEIVVALQPIVATGTGETVGAEALARFPTLGAPPDVVFGDAERAGVGPELEHAAVRTATAVLSVLPRHCYLSLNVGPTGALSDELAVILDDAPLDRLVLEITEHDRVAEYEPLLERLEDRRGAGLRVAVDDVGAGYASLQHVLQLRPDIVKVDRSLVDGIADDPARRSAFTGIVDLASAIDADVVAEGVERRADVVALTELGVGLAQGFLFARPSTDPGTWASWTAGCPPSRPRAGPPGSRREVPYGREEPTG